MTPCRRAARRREETVSALQGAHRARFQSLRVRSGSDAPIAAKAPLRGRSARRPVGADDAGERDLAPAGPRGRARPPAIATRSGVMRPPSPKRCGGARCACACTAPHGRRIPVQGPQRCERVEAVTGRDSRARAAFFAKRVCPGTRAERVNAPTPALPRSRPKRSTARGASRIPRIGACLRSLGISLTRETMTTY